MNDLVIFAGFYTDSLDNNESSQRDACLVQDIYKQSNVQRIRMNSTSHSGTHDMHRQQNISGRQCGTHDCHWGCVHQHSAMLAASKVDPGPHPSIYFVWWINFVSRVSKLHEDKVMHCLARYVPLSGLDKGFLCQQSCTHGGRSTSQSPESSAAAARTLTAGSSLELAPMKKPVFDIQYTCSTKRKQNVPFSFRMAHDNGITMQNQHGRTSLKKHSTSVCSRVAADNIS